MDNTNLASVAEHEAAAIIARVGDLPVTRASRGRFLAPTWLVAIARAELDAYARGDTSADWAGMWALARNEDWSEEASRRAILGYESLLNWLVEWGALFGIVSFPLPRPSRLPSPTLDLAS